MTPHSTAAPVPGYTSYRRNVRCVHWLQQVARIRSLVHGLALQRMQEFLHLGTTLMHSGEKGVGVADRMALNESTVNYRWITEVTGAHSWQFFATMLQHITFSFLSYVCVCVCVCPRWCKQGNYFQYWTYCTVIGWREQKACHHNSILCSRRILVIDVSGIYVTGQATKEIPRLLYDQPFLGNTG